MSQSTATLPLTKPDVDLDTLVTPYEENDDPNHRTHIVRGQENDKLWTEGMRAQDLVNMARMLGTEITALCGHKWVPAHNPEKFDICDPCIKIAMTIKGQ